MININGKEWDDVQLDDIIDIVKAPEMEESFFYEFKDDRVQPKKLVEEISAFANTFGGYIFIGISDEKEIKGCFEWDEQRIHTTIHDSITPVPLFDVKKIVFKDNKIIYILRIEQGPEPPYITIQGKIYERLSSGSFPIKESSKLSQIYLKREQLIDRLEKKISIPELKVQSNNIYGYIDLGFAVYFHNDEIASTKLLNVKSGELNQIIKKSYSTANAFIVGESILITPGGVHSDKNLPSHMNNFLEIMADGSARMRILLSNNDPNQISVNLLLPSVFLWLYSKWYTEIIGDLFPEQFIYAKKYEALTVLTQFQPEYYYEDYLIEKYPELASKLSDNVNIVEDGVNKVIVTNDRIPKTGLYTIDRRIVSKLYGGYSKETIIGELFYSRFIQTMIQK